MAKVIVFHEGYGCDTGCCGHRIEMGDQTDFEFVHPHGEEPHAYAERLVTEIFGAEHVKDLDWDNCVIVDD